MTGAGQPGGAIFRWHDAARLIDGAGRAFGPAGPCEGGVLADADAVAALRSAIGSPAFRIGATGAPSPRADRVPAGAPVLETLSGGTSGTPRRILRTQASWIASFDVNARLFGIGPGARVAVLGRLVHSLALYAAIEALHLGAEAHLLDRLRPDRQAEALALRDITHLYATPAQLRSLPATARPCPGLRHLIVGGAQLDPALKDRMALLFPSAVQREFYGASETSFLTVTDADTPRGSVGAAYPGVEIALDPDGAIWARSPYLALGYAGEPGGARWRDGWVCAGETGRMDGGYLFLSGRIGRAIRVAEQTLHPEEMETFLLSRPGVEEAAVLPRPDAARGLVLVAVIRGDPTAEAALLVDLRAAFGPMLSPRTIRWWQADWPQLPSGKTDLQAIERELRW
ncbi:AMP-binding protein [Aliigemmobacter aestuarii]|uniref:AMP-binding protein n=1 Tax=Aliigemmobacter aestuarii TaxID=1445661 RepID=UPI001454C752|nr:AMP-binding protein [Gemmobacter aestuarii]